MGDLLLDLSGNSAGRTLLGMFGLPKPQPLRRCDGPWEVRCLEKRSMEVGGVGTCTAAIVRMLASAGASTSDTDASVQGLVFDATSITELSDLRALYDFFHPRVGNLSRCGRIVIVGRHGPQASPQAAAAQAALLGFCKSLAKEIGRKGSTANLLRVAVGAEDALDGPLRFLLSDRSAFVSGQALDVRAAAAAPTELWTQPLEGKTALVTGAVRGIGRETACRLAAEGARVLCLDMPAEEEALSVLAAQIGGVAVPTDITAVDAAEVIAVAAGGPLHVLVHNAGITRDRTLAKLDEAWWDLTLAVNLEAVHTVTTALLDQAVLASGGRVVLVSSIAGLAGNVGQTHYAASKAGIVGLVAGLTDSLWAQHITVNAVAPGFVETRLTAAIPFTIREAGRRLSNLCQGGIPLDIAEVITFFASPGASGLRGNVLRVCGGNLIGA
jgi:3-oxoacyl-[acyl-carrier protein] reductase